MPLADGLDRVLRGLGVGVEGTGPAQGGAAIINAVFERWPGLVGAHLVDHVQPVSLRGTTLVVAVAEPAWASQLGWPAPDICAAADRLVGSGAVTAVEVRVRP